MAALRCEYCPVLQPSIARRRRCQDEHIRRWRVDHCPVEVCLSGARSQKDLIVAFRLNRPDLCLYSGRCVSSVAGQNVDTPLRLTASSVSVCTRVTEFLLNPIGKNLLKQLPTFGLRIFPHSRARNYIHLCQCLYDVFAR